MTDREYLKKYLDSSKWNEGFKLLQGGEPLQYIIGDVNFCGSIIKVNSNVLIPRFETELLVEKTINYVKENFDSKVKIIDLGTGSGAIAITLMKKLDCMVDAIDISPKALEVAKENALLNKTDIKFFESDMFEKVNGRYDVIISNPPYVSYDEKIDDIVKNNEPAIALFAENNGLEFYEKILSLANNYVNDKAIIALEIGRSQGSSVKKIAYKYFPKAKIKVEKDLPGEDRFVFIFISN